MYFLLFINMMVFFLLIWMILKGYVIVNSNVLETEDSTPLFMGPTGPPPPPEKIKPIMMDDAKAYEIERKELDSRRH